MHEREEAEEKLRLGMADDREGLPQEPEELLPAVP
jgi:hypothetical protein